VPNTPSLITFSSRGYIKRMPASTWQAQRRGGKGGSGRGGELPRPGADMRVCDLRCPSSFNQGMSVHPPCVYRHVVWQAA
jgi:hypothetical protein